MSDTAVSATTFEDEEILYPQDVIEPYECTDEATPIDQDEYNIGIGAILSPSTKALPMIVDEHLQFNMDTKVNNNYEHEIQMNQKKMYDAYHDMKTTENYQKATVKPYESVDCYVSTLSNVDWSCTKPSAPVKQKKVLEPSTSKAIKKELTSLETTLRSLREKFEFLKDSLPDDYDTKELTRYITALKTLVA